MNKRSILSSIKEIDRPFFSTGDLSVLSGKSLSSVSQTLSYLERENVVVKIYRGVWAEAGKRLSPYPVIPFVLPGHRAYVSFISALHLYGIIEQIPQEITIASTAHTRKIRTAAGTFDVHRIAPPFFKGFKWQAGGDFLIAEQEKALIDSLYISSRRNKRFGFFPEMDFPEDFSRKKAEKWVSEIPDSKIRSNVQKKIERIFRAP